MQSRWNDSEAARYQGDDLAMRVYTSRLLGADPELVLHGGGNTSVKGSATNLFGEELQVLFVKGSGWDLKTIEPEGFPAIRLHDTQRLAELDTLSDPEMTRQLRLLMLDPSAPSPSVEAILHAIIPQKFVDHTHTDAVVTLSNNPAGEQLLAELYPDCLILPYVMPGFILSRQVKAAIAGKDLNACKGIILMHHGVFTFDDNPRTAYEDMIELVTRADTYIASKGDSIHPTAQHSVDLLQLAAIRRAVSLERGCAQLAVLDSTPDAQGFAARDDVESIACRGPITPDHVIRTKRIPAVIADQPVEGVPEIAQFAAAYRDYFARHGNDSLQILDQAPRTAVWKNNGTLAFGSSARECGVITDIARHTRWAIQTGESLGGWQALPEADIFELEYWSLEQAKLGKAANHARPHQGKVALVTGAYSGIGRATCEALARDGAAVAGVDINPAIEGEFASSGMLGVWGDLTDDQVITQAIEHTVARFGGLDILVCNAGVFSAGERIEAMNPDTWDSTMAINLTATQRLLSGAIAFLKLGINATVLVVGSRNATAPGPGAAAYSVSKAAITQLARVAALELAAERIRVNVVHPDAVFDTGLWTDTALAQSAARYGMNIEDYKARNLLKCEIQARDVAALLSVMASDTFRATTGAQVPLDGGSDRVI